MPHLAPSKFSTEIVGENSYQKSIRKVIMYKDLVDKNDFDFKWEKLKASLILEDDNKYDLGNAVRVEMDNLTVGYLAKEDAKLYREALRELNITEVCTCKAGVYGKRESLGQMMKFGIWLFIDLREELHIEEPPKRKKLFGIF